GDPRGDPRAPVLRDHLVLGLRRVSRRFDLREAVKRLRGARGACRRAGRLRVRVQSLPQRVCPRGQRRRRRVRVIYLVLACRTREVKRVECLGTLATDALAEWYRAEGWAVEVLEDQSPRDTSTRGVPGARAKAKVQT